MNEDISLEKIRKCRVQLEYSNPFFAYLLLHLKPKKFSKELEESLKKSGQKPTIAVDVENNLYYSEDFVKELDNEMLTNVLLHELGHLFLSHHFRLERQFKECREVANISADLVVNDLLIKNNFRIDGLGEGYCYPTNDEFKFGRIKIKEISKKTAEEIYDEIMKQAEDKNMLRKVKVFDNHLFDGGKKGGGGDGENEDDEEGLSQKKFEREWKKRMIEGYEHAKMRGKTPKGMERFVDSLLENKINWRQILQKEIKNEIISDFTWNRRSKKSLATNYYLPSIKKENLDIKVVIDLSGSISDDDLKDFLSEMIGMSKTFRNQINMEVITHEMEINDITPIRQANEEKILELKLNGGGGTSFLPTIKYLNENNRNRQLVVWLTDGYAEPIQNEQINFKIVWVLAKNGSEDCIEGIGKIVRLDDG